MTRFAYAAHTRSAIFFLDDDGVCQDIAGTSAGPPPRELLRCIGAQYVASLDRTEETGLTSLPREGASMLFVVADPQRARARFSLVRTAPLERFETLADEADVVDLPDVTVSWPATDMLARTLPIPPSELNLLAPPRPIRTPSTLSA